MHYKQSNFLNFNFPIFNNYGISLGCNPHKETLGLFFITSKCHITRAKVIWEKAESLGRPNSLFVFLDGSRELTNVTYDRQTDHDTDRCARIGIRAIPPKTCNMHIEETALNWNEGVLASRVDKQKACMCLFDVFTASASI